MFRPTDPLPSRWVVPLLGLVSADDRGVSGPTATITGMTWSPQIGEPLPRADAAWQEPVKLEDWILAERGHGKEWRRVFRVGPEDRERVWHAIFAAVQSARILSVRDREAGGIVCGVEVELTIGGRSAPVRMSWHYARETSSPRLVTAYPKL